MQSDGLEPAVSRMQRGLAVVLHACHLEYRLTGGELICEC